MRGRYHHVEEGNRARCDVCPRGCLLSPGQRGFCYVREGVDGGVALTTYGRSSGFCIDPIEKKPLNHFLPGTSVLSFGTAGCNLGCMFCQNWDISKSKHDDTLQSSATPEQIAASALAQGCRSVAFTYNDPTIFVEYAVDTALACRARGVKSVAVTNGYIAGRAREDLYAHMDAANIDLKAFTEEFYAKTCLAHLEPVKETLRYAVHETKCWVEITTLLIPGQNDGDAELTALAEFVAGDLGVDVPLHFTAFHPDYKMDKLAHTPPATLQRARAIAKCAGLRHVYVGNVHDSEGASTWCHGCGALLVERDWYTLGAFAVAVEGTRGACRACGTALPGVFDAKPGTWGARRVPLRVLA